MCYQSWLYRKCDAPNRVWQGGDAGMCGINSGVTRDGHYRTVDDVMALRLAFGKVRTDIICSWSLPS